MATARASTIEEPAGMQAQLLDAAEDCFERFGIAKTTMEDVAKAGGVSRATVYRYFTDREALVLASITRRARMNIPRAQAHIQRFPSFAEKLVEGLIYNVDRGHKDPVVQLLVTGDQPGLAARILGGEGVSHQLTYELWKPILETAQRSGEMRADLDLHEAARWLARITTMMVSQEEGMRLAPEDLRRELRTFLVPAFLA
ncbi:helix-turn-helix domain-containing protein [Pseudonocardia yuanmonensis]